MSEANVTDKVFILGELALSKKNQTSAWTT